MDDARRQVRLFAGVKLSMAAVGDLATAAESLRRRASDMELPVRWIAPASYHITLKLLGWTRPEALAAIRDVLASSLDGMPGFEVSGRGLGASPDPEQATVLWAEIEDPGGGLARLATLLDQELGELGFARDKGPFHAHVTLGRLQQPSDVSALVHEQSGQMFRQSRVDAVVLGESNMKTPGSEYVMRARFPLGSPPQRAKRHTGPLKPAPDASPDQEEHENGAKRCE